MTTGATIIAKTLKSQGITCVFGVVGIPVIEIAEACRAQGILFVAMRNEQSATYAANAWGFLSGKPGVCLVVGGPGFVHALSGLSNAKENCWPMILIAGSTDTNLENHGGFQEFPQVEASRLYTKFSSRPSCLTAFPYVLEKAIRSTLYGRPGPAYIDIPGNFIVDEVDERLIQYPRIVSVKPLCQANDIDIDIAVNHLSMSKKPLIIVGKGTANSVGASSAILNLVEFAKIPFLPMPMAKGIITDTHPSSASAARSIALKNADVVLLFGARLNWMLHFGLIDRFNADVIFIQVDICAEELGNNCNGNFIGLHGDVSLVSNQLFQKMKARNIKFPSNWLHQLQQTAVLNMKKTSDLVNYQDNMMNYYQAITAIKKFLPKNFILVNEGANTMDIGRIILDHSNPKQRLDAGSFGTMGVGLGFAIAAQIMHPETRVVCIQGDSAFGFSGMDFETVSRLSLPIVVIIINNNGIYSGVGSDEWKDLTPHEMPSTGLSPNAHYERIAEAFGAKGYFCENRGNLENALHECFSTSSPAIINCLISPSSGRQPQKHSWLTRSKSAL